MDANVIGTVIWITVAAVAGAALVGFIVFALVDVLRTTTISSAARLIWAAVVVLAPLLGTAAWYLVGQRTPELERSLRAFAR
ncbi:PLDc N-terminal domain-containing protein [Compostimonas suwonensis]|uniref:Phospholipase D-like protein n=1 Tax=Compostimonas suwonensis TaxID=1048394 RepID=A0A2M9C3I9_9MICO|nr:PLDc N-terminal domain-containing protein [Compostimonas suwonensis]PJJ65078.1 phospholipase D-like protein [Compostimonas suwonensis]